MLRRIMSEVDVKSGLQEVLKRIDEVCAHRPQQVQLPKPLLVAVSKTKPAELVIEAYKAGQRHFGENYVQELVEKSQHADILEQCPDIKWHFIGHLQSNKINKIVRIPNLYMIQTVESEKHANILNTAWEKLEKDNKEPLRVLIQINTSCEEAKGGVSPNEAPKLYKFIYENLKQLKLEGVMTIGSYGFDYSTGPNPDFLSLMNVHRAICEANRLAPESLQVSMGMSNDYDRAIELGSTIVRVGTSIFGQRPKKSD